MAKEQIEKKMMKNDYASLLMQIKERVRSAQYEALRAVNRELITLYWDIGHLISRQQQAKAHGRRIVENLAKDLQMEFPGVGGFSAANLWRIRNFYLTYAKNTKLAPMVREISWTKNILIVERCKDELEREFYIRMTQKFGWSKNVLALQIENQSYEKAVTNQTNFDATLPAKIRNQAKLAVKDEYMFDFLELGPEHSERQLERAIIDRVEHFLREMGGKFAFLGSQYRIEVDGQEYFIDLLLYHRGLKCLLAIELKIGDFLPEYVGKMQFYLAALDDLVRIKGENPSVGMILCKSKNKAIVEYALRESNKPIGVATYRIVKQLPKEFKGQLPEPKQIIKLLETITDNQ